MFPPRLKRIKSWPTSSSSSSSPSPVIKLSFTSRKMSVVKNWSYFSLILLTFNPGKICIYFKEQKQLAEQERDFYQNIFHNICVNTRKLLLWFKHIYMFSVQFIFCSSCSVWTELDWMHWRMFPILSCNPFYLTRNPQLLFFAKNNTKYTTEAVGGFLNHYFSRITKYIGNLDCWYWW